MTNATEEKILSVLEEIKESINERNSRPLIMSLPDAASYLNVSYGWLRGMCLKGVIPSTPKNELDRGDDKFQHRLIDVNEAKRVILAGGYQTKVVSRFHTKEI